MPECDTVQAIVNGIIAVVNLVTLILVKKTRTVTKETAAQVAENTEITLATQAAVSRPLGSRTRSTDR